MYIYIYIFNHLNEEGGLQPSQPLSINIYKATFFFFENIYIKLPLNRLKLAYYYTVLFNGRG